MELKYTEKETTNNGNSVNMLLFGTIGGEISARYFIDEMQWHNDNNKHIVLKINSPGGSVFDGYGIMNAVEEMGADTYIVGLAASMAGVISQVGKKRTANHRAVFMAHAPKNGSKDLLGIVKQTLSRELTDRSTLSEDEITAIMEKKGDTFFDADTMYEKGLIDELITTGQKLTNVVNKSSDELYTAYDSLLNTPNPKKMEKVMNYLGLENKTEDDVLNIVKGLEVKAAKVDELETEVTNLTNEVKTLKEAAQSELTNKATVLIENAIKDCKIKEDLKDVWLEQAKNNFELAEKTLGGLSIKKATSITNIIDKSGDGEKDYAYLAQNEPEVLNQMAEENPEKFDALVKAHGLKTKQN